MALMDVGLGRRCGFAFRSVALQSDARSLRHRALTSGTGSLRLGPATALPPKIIEPAKALVSRQPPSEDSVASAPDKEPPPAGDALRVAAKFGGGTFVMGSSARK